MRCPICSQNVPPKTENAYFPMCSKRCQAVDLGRWLGEEYVIPGPPAFVPEADLNDDGER